MLRAVADKTLSDDDIHMLSDSEDPIWKPEQFLRQSDKRILETSNEWLNDRLVFAGMLLLKQQFPDISGFCDPVMVQSLRCTFKDKMFVQVVYNGSHHWITTTNMNCRPGVVRVYDSLHLMLNIHVKQQIAAMYHATQPMLEIQSMNVARQSGSGDCGLMALAYATSLCFKLDPVNLVYCQENLRQHFLQCVIDGKMTAFPVSSNRTVRKPVAFKTIEKIYCVCR